MLKPRAAKIPETLDKTPGSFWTKQLKVCLCHGKVVSAPVGTPDTIHNEKPAPHLLYGS